MAAKQLVTFEDLIDSLIEELGIQSSDTTTINKLKRMVNMVYLNEIAPQKRWRWLEGNTRVVHKAYYSASTCIATPSSTAITLNSTPVVGLGSFAGYNFSVQGFDEIYTIESHTAGTAAIVLTSEFQGSSSSAATYKYGEIQLIYLLTAKKL